MTINSVSIAMSARDLKISDFESDVFMKDQRVINTIAFIYTFKSYALGSLTL